MILPPPNSIPIIIFIIAIMIIIIFITAPIVAFRLQVRVSAQRQSSRRLPPGLSKLAPEVQGGGGRVEGPESGRDWLKVTTILTTAVHATVISISRNMFRALAANDSYDGNGGDDAIR